MGVAGEETRTMNVVTRFLLVFVNEILMFALDWMAFLGFQNAAAS